MIRNYILLAIKNFRKQQLFSVINVLGLTIGIACCLLIYLFITHDLGTVKRIANKVVVMLKGRIVASGDTASVFTPPHHPYTELLLSSVPDMRGEWLDEVLGSRKALQAAARDAAAQEAAAQ